MIISLTLNGRRVSLEAAPDALLLDVLRDAGMKSVKFGCREGACGSCAVLLDGSPVPSCLTFAAQAEGRGVETVEGVGTVDRPHPLMTALSDEGAVQCGYCTPGIILVAKALLARNPSPSRAEIERALDGNLCRCTGYVKIVTGIERAARILRGEETDGAREGSAHAGSEAAAHGEEGVL